MRQITLETSKDTLQELHELVDSNGRRKLLSVKKAIYQGYL